MLRILCDKIAKIPGGNLLWASLAMDLAKTLGVRRPREIIGFLAGRSRLEDGSYQSDKAAILQSELIEQSLLTDQLRS
jgi:hypothetical protein